jgi:3-hydroxyisobutyrate dehydrogenase-like beta-hydroxyacid dehydrogenase
MRVPKVERIGFAGVGVMGHGMASRILDAGYPLTVIAHRNRSRVEDLVGRGAREAADFAELAESSDILVLCVSNSVVVESVVASLEPSLRQEMMIIDTGTSSPESSRALDARLGSLGVRFVEAPVTGGVKQAAAGELGALVGADPAGYEQAAPLLRAMCTTVHHFGPVGAGNTAKLLNNFMVMGIAALVTEAFGRAREGGIDWRKLYDVVVCGSADSGVLRRIIGSAVEGDYKGYVFSVDGALKDMRYFCELADSMDEVSPLGSAVREVYENAVDAGYGDRLLSELLAPEMQRK